MDDEWQGSLDDLRSALDASGVVGTWDWDIVRHTARYDRGAADLLALDPALAGQPLHGDAAMVGIHLDDREWLRSELRRALEGGGLFLAEYRVVTPTRGIRWLLSRGRVYQDQLGRPVRSKGILIDITESREEGTGYLARMSTRGQHPLDRAANALLEARKAVDEAGSEAQSHLRVVLDLALYEVGAHLARRARH
ncbi:PAS domain-containing protein [Methylobacterium sp. J-076]|uniref:PAS domain-containing protein n=1 Tax=Methylobacterium sp. J-076 TaxID=2836655 RepID=UPI001FB938F1|nr:PAS domain-containing protein [Methylobacterium sp. J-076]MCJ2014872.1 PAS domain-containing protein [Methylobacterium sp. J-076]